MVLRALGWIAIVAIAILSLVPGELRPHTGTSQYFEHFLAYLLTSAALALAYEGRFRALTLFAYLVSYAGVLETAQLWVPGRLARISDFTASSLGILAGIASITLMQWNTYRRMK